MESPQGRILSVRQYGSDLRAIVEIEAAVRCARCASGRGCGAGLLGGDERPRQVEATIPRDLDVRQGDTVRIELAADDLMRASLLAYGWPLGGALLGAAVSWTAGFHDSGAAIAALMGALAGFFVGRSSLHKNDCLMRFTPSVIARLGPTER